MYFVVLSSFIWWKPWLQLLQSESVVSLLQWVLPWPTYLKWWCHLSAFPVSSVLLSFLSSRHNHRPTFLFWLSLWYFRLSYNFIVCCLSPSTRSKLHKAGIFINHIGSLAHSRCWRNRLNEYVRLLHLNSWEEIVGGVVSGLKQVLHLY